MKLVLVVGIWIALTAVVAVHEIAHAVVARRRGIALREVSVGIGPALFTVPTRFLGVPVRVRLLPAGGACYYDDRSAPRSAVVWSAVAGPLASIAAGIAVLGATSGLDGLVAAGKIAAAVPGAIGELVRAFVEWRPPHPASVNLPGLRHGALSLAGLLSVLLGATNLLPVPPLDGWRIVSGGLRSPVVRRLDPALGVLGAIATISVFVLPYSAPYVPRGTALGALVAGSAAGLAFVLARKRGRCAG